MFGGLYMLLMVVHWRKLQCLNGGDICSRFATKDGRLVVAGRHREGTNGIYHGLYLLDLRHQNLPQHDVATSDDDVGKNSPRISTESTMLPYHREPD